MGDLPSKRRVHGMHLRLDCTPGDHSTVREHCDYQAGVAEEGDSRVRAQQSSVSNYAGQAAPAQPS